MITYIKWKKTPFFSPAKEIKVNNRHRRILINNILHLARKYARTFVHGNMFVPRKLWASRNRWCPRKISEQIFKPNGGYCLYCPSNIFLQRAFGEYHRIFLGFSWGLFSHVMRLDQSRARENIWWVFRLSISSRTWPYLDIVSMCWTINGDRLFAVHYKKNFYFVGLCRLALNC